MKTNATIFCLFLMFFAYIAKAQSGWFPRTSNTTEVLSSITFNQLNGYVTGTNGTILKTTDGGLTWASQTSGVNTPLTGIYNPFDDIAYACGNNGVVLKTTDGGANWNSLTTNTTEHLASLFFLSQDIGYAVGDHGKILFTNDGGATWNINTIGTGNYYYNVYFTDGLTGYVCGSNGTIVKTTNGGSTWNLLATGITNTLLSIYFIDQNNGFVVGQNGLILHTTDAGANWASITSNTTESLISVSFNNENSFGYICGSNGTILFTTDGGLSWTSQNSNTTFGLNCIYYRTITKNQAFCVGTNGTILNTSSMGAIPYLVLSTTQTTLGPDAGSNTDIDIDANTTWSAASNQSWLSVTPDFSINSGTITVTAEANPSATPRDAIITIAGGNVATQLITVTQEAPNQINELKIDGISVFPNPVKDIIHITSQAEVIKEIVLTDIKGKIISKYYPFHNQFQVNVAQLQNGNYMLKICTNKSDAVVKIIK